MIAFEEDWKYYPNAIVDTQTPNKSFIKICSLLKKMGVKHYYFPLALLQPELQGVNPHDEENLTLAQKAMILYEVDNNPWYYLREIVIDDGAGPTLDDCRFKANRAGIAAMWLTITSIDYIRIQPRQTGKSFETDNKTLYLMYFVYRHTSLNLITQDEDLRKSNIGRLKKLRDAWPDYINRNTKKDDNNQSTLSCRDRDNRLYTKVSQTSKKAANNIGRGMTSPKILIDEPAFINYIETTISAAAGSTSAAREIAQKNRNPYGFTYTTTAGDKESRDGKFVYNLMNSGAVWNEAFYDCKNREELVDMIGKHSSSRSPLINLTMSHRQLGYTDEWLYNAIATTRSEGDNIEKDYFNRWSTVGSKPLIEERVANMMRKGEMNYPLRNQVYRENYVFKWYEEIDPNRKYILAVDTSNAIGNDDISVELIDITNGAVVGASAFNDTNLQRFSEWLLNFMLEVKNSLLIIENKLNAQNIIDFLILNLPEHGENPFKRMFNRIFQEPEKYEKEYKDIVRSTKRPKEIYGRYRKYFGFMTSKSSRSVLYDMVLQRSLDYAGGLIRDSQIIGQIMGLEIRNGRIDHGEDGHDDMVITWLMAQWLLLFGVNLSEYDIPSRDVLSRKVHSGTLEEDPLADYRQRRQGELKDEVDAIYDRLASSNDSKEITRLEIELEHKLVKIDTDEDLGSTLNSMLEKAKNERSKYHRKSGGGGSSKYREFLSRFKL